MNIFGLVLLLLVGVVVYFHFVQGLFSATLSAILAAFAALVAISYHEQVAQYLVNAKFPDMAIGISLIGLFAATYLVLRFIFDKLIPGNVQFPLWVDRIGAAIMGLVAGIFAGGIVAIGAQSLPFGPGIWGYSRYDLADQRTATLQLQVGARAQDLTVNDEVKVNTLGASDTPQNHMLLPVDDWVVAIAGATSDGAMSGDVRFKEVHPDYLLELFGNRLGIQVGAPRSAVNNATGQAVKVVGVYTPKQLAQADEEIDKIRAATDKLPPSIAVDSDHSLVVVRTIFSGANGSTGDADKLFRFSTGSVRLVVNGKDYFPIGTLEGASTVFIDKPDDPLFVDLGGGDHGVDLVFLVDAPATSGERLPPGSFLEVKRFARVDLTSDAYAFQPTVADPGTAVGVLRKTLALAAAGKGPNAPAPVAPTPTGPVLTSIKAIASNRLFAKLNVGTSDKTVAMLNFASGNGSGMLQDGKFKSLQITPGVPLKDFSGGENPVDTFYVPDGATMVQVSANAGEGDAWAWAEDLTRFEAIDTAGGTHAVNGAWAKSSRALNVYLTASYAFDGPAPAIKKGEGRATAIWLAFVIPNGTQIKEIHYKGQTIATISPPVP